MKTHYIGRVELHCAIRCWRSQAEKLLVPSLAAADVWVRSKHCAYCGEGLVVANPLAQAAIAEMEAAGLTASAVNAKVSSKPNG